MQNVHIHVLSHAQCMQNVLLQWNLSIVDTLGTTKNVLISEVSCFRGSYVHNSIYLAGTLDSVLIKEMSS